MADASPNPAPEPPGYRLTPPSPRPPRRDRKNQTLPLNPSVSTRIRSRVRTETTFADAFPREINSGGENLSGVYYRGQMSRTGKSIAALVEIVPADSTRSVIVGITDSQRLEGDLSPPGGHSEKNTRALNSD